MHIRRLIHAALARADYAIVEAESAREALEMLRDERPDIVLLDLGLPDRDGLELVPLVKQQSDTTLIVVSARDATDQKVAALDLGADDYLTKPFDTDELLARVRVALRNRMTRDGGMLTVTAGDVTDRPDRAHRRQGGPRGPSDAQGICGAGAGSRGTGGASSHNQIMAEVWPREVDHHVEYLRVLVRTLRQKLESDPQQPQIISNELGIGYRLRSVGEEAGQGQ